MRRDFLSRHFRQRPILFRRGYVGRRFRWYLITVPLAIWFLLWLSRGIQPSLSWDQVMDNLQVSNRERFTQFVVLGVLVTAGVIVLRILRGPREEDED